MSSASLLPTEAASFTSAAQAYAQDFVERCAACADDTRVLIDVKTSLRKIKGFSLRDFDKLVREEKGKIFGAGGVKANGHAGDWTTMLLRSKEGRIKPLLANAITALRSAPEWQGILAFDEFGNRAHKKSAPPFLSPVAEWSDTDDILTANWLQHAGIEVGPSITGAAVQAVAIEHTFHPIRDYLQSLRWDGEKRIGRWLTDYLGVEFSEYAAQVGAKWLISAVARVMRPGCKVDTCLILEGFQGRMKSTALAALFNDQWFSDQISADLAGKDSSQDLPGKWCFEFAEFDKLSKYDQGIIKSFIPRRIDHYRPSYGQRSVDIPRQCVFSASTNKETYLQDETGGRRWWPVTCLKIDADALSRDRDQLWAETYACFCDGTSAGLPVGGLWWIVDETVIEASKSEQAARYDADPWDSIVWTWIQERERIETEEENYKALRDRRPPEPWFVQSDSILEVCLKKPVGQWTQMDKIRVSKILRFHGLERFQRRVTTIEGEPVLDARGVQRREWYYRRAEK